MNGSLRGQGRQGHLGGRGPPTRPQPAHWATLSSPFRPTPLVAQSLALRWAGFEVCTTRCCMSRQVRFLLQRAESEARGSGRGLPCRGHWGGRGCLLGFQGESDDAGCQGGRGRGARVRLGALLPQVRGHLPGGRCVGPVMSAGTRGATCPPPAHRPRAPTDGRGAGARTPQAQLLPRSLAVNRLTPGPPGACFPRHEGLSSRLETVQSRAHLQRVYASQGLRTAPWPHSQSQSAPAPVPRRLSHRSPSHTWSGKGALSRASRQAPPPPPGQDSRSASRSGCRCCTWWPVWTSTPRCTRARCRAAWRC